MRKFRWTRALALAAFACAVSSCGGSAASGGSSDPGVNSSAGSAASATRYTSEEGKFSITPPEGYGPFAEKKETSPTPAGEGRSHYLTSKNASGHLAVVEYHVLPEALFQKDKIRAGLEGMRDEFLGKVTGVMESSEPVTVRGHEALAVRGFNSLPDNQGFAYFRLVYVAAPPRLYRVGLISTDKADLDTTGANAYFDSFQLAQ
jgi:hypothetical protein